MADFYLFSLSSGVLTHYAGYNAAGVTEPRSSGKPPSQWTNDHLGKYLFNKDCRNFCEYVTI